MARRRLKMTKKCIAARRRYKAKKAGVPTRRRKPTGTRRRRRRGKGPKGAGFWEDIGHGFEQIGQVALQVLPFVAAAL